MKILRVLAPALVLAVLLSGCTGGGDDQVTLNVYNWGEYIDEDILATFTEETGIAVNYDTYATNEDMYAKLKSGGVSYDIAIPSDYMVQRMIDEDMLETLDPDNIPNLQYIFGWLKELEYDPGCVYSVPYMWGTLGILYNTDLVDDPVDSWNILWDEKYSGQIFMYNSQRDSFAVALKKLGYSLNTRDLTELEAAKAELILQAPLVRAYLGDTVRDSMIGNEAALAVVYSGDAIYCIENNPALAYAVPREGSNVWCDAVVIPKGSLHKAEAEKFIDFLCRTDISLKNTEYIGYSTVNTQTFDLLPAEMREDPAYWPGEDIFRICEVFVDLGSFLKEYDRAWTEVLASK
ncbi:MAG: ABC transporter substrate-binding protein [Clostridiales bacterium]|jgi:spermidine/putrescine transport system substrate-binding protein|nr:ABC transporter substrate-binding protein [Clostridiales bacterium]